MNPRSNTQTVAVDEILATEDDLELGEATFDSKNTYKTPFEDPAMHDVSSKAHHMRYRNMLAAIARSQVTLEHELQLVRASIENQDIRLLNIVERTYLDGHRSGKCLGYFIGAPAALALFITPFVVFVVAMYLLGKK